MERLLFKGRKFLFLQAPASPFAFRLAMALRAVGADIVKVHLCGGDLVFWRGTARLYRNKREDWHGFITALFADGKVTDLVLFGDCRPYHKIAVTVARAHGVRLHLFEEGYIRPGYITCENYGVNAHSDLPHTPEAVLEAAAALAEPNPVPPLNEPFLRRALWDIAWQAGLLVFAPLFARYHRHTLMHPAIEYAGWLLHALRTPIRRRSDRNAQSRIDEGLPYFLFPLQLPGDFQMRVHSDFKSVEDVAQVVISSFARTAPATARLVVKRHPYDVAFSSSARMVSRIAASCGVADRVIFLESGDIGPVVIKADGIVVVNSTTAMLALANRRPLKVLGRATYNMPGLAHQGPLDDFWVSATPAESNLARAYRQLVIVRTQIPGGFFSPTGIARAVAGCLTRMSSPAASAQKLDMIQSDQNVLQGGND